MLKLSNIIIITFIIVLSVYLVQTNYDIYSLHHKSKNLIKEYQLNQKINKQLQLEITHKSSNIYIQDYALQHLNMHPIDIIRTLD